MPLFFETDFLGVTTEETRQVSAQTCQIHVSAEALNDSNIVLFVLDLMKFAPDRELLITLKQPTLYIRTGESG